MELRRKRIGGECKLKHRTYGEKVFMYKCTHIQEKVYKTDE